uniref:Fe2OG dioxygenase domain-containing protein n=1 Tax=Ditylenchus dipsaci TaxID=166011 RepID=A0A915DS95_9BILA
MPQPHMLGAYSTFMGGVDRMDQNISNYRIPQEDPQLYCYYKMDRPYLRLAPFKVEIVGRNPLVALFRNVLSNSESELIKELARPQLLRARVQNGQTGKSEAAAYRVSKSAWLKETDAIVIERINKRSGLMTNLNMETAEQLQVANYGIGGHYFPHYDFAMKEDVNPFGDLQTGNRIATLLFYMSQVEHGGGTVFTESKLAIQPTKNDALFWYNLHRSGDGDLRTKHAACPVLLGVKWISNKWMHERGQEFTRPCALKPSVNERFVGDLES